MEGLIKCKGTIKDVFVSKIYTHSSQNDKGQVRPTEKGKNRIKWWISGVMLKFIFINIMYKKGTGTRIPFS